MSKAAFEQQRNFNQQIDYKFQEETSKVLHFMVKMGE